MRRSAELSPADGTLGLLGARVNRAMEGSIGRQTAGCSSSKLNVPNKANGVVQSKEGIGFGCEECR